MVAFPGLRHKSFVFGHKRILTLLCCLFIIAMNFRFESFVLTEQHFTEPSKAKGMEKLVLLSALLVTLLVELCSAAGAFAQQPSSMRTQQKAEDLRSIREFGQLNEVSISSFTCYFEL